MVICQTLHSWGHGVGGGGCWEGFAFTGSQQHAWCTCSVTPSISRESIYVGEHGKLCVQDGAAMSVFPKTDQSLCNLCLSNRLHAVALKGPVYPRLRGLIS